MKFDLVLTPVAANKWCPYSSEHCFVLMVLVYGHKSRLKLQDCPNTGQFNFTNSLRKLCFIPFLADPKYFQVGSRQAKHILLSSFSVEQGRKVAMENILLGQKKNTIGNRIASEFYSAISSPCWVFFQLAFCPSENDIMLNKSLVSPS